MRSAVSSTSDPTAASGSKWPRCTRCSTGSKRAVGWKAGGRKKPASAAGVSIASRAKAGGYSPPSAPPGRASRRPWPGSRRWNMDRWRDEVRRRLEGLDLPADRELAIVEELSQHLFEREAALLAAGTSPDKARRIVLDEIAEHELLRRGLQAIPRPPVIDVPGLPPTGGPAWRHLVQDIRYAVRTLTRDRAYTLTAVLALGI